MKISRFSINDEIFYGKLDQDKVVRLRSLSKEETILELTDDVYCLKDLTQLPPVNPLNIYGVGDNYPRSIHDQSIPIIFKKSSKSIVMNHSEVVLPAGKQVWPEPEIGIVIKKELTGVTEENYAQYILGYILINDVTCIEPGSVSDTHTDDSKNQVGFCPVGSFIQTDFNFLDSDIFSEINNIPYRNGRVKLFKWNISKLLKEVGQKHKLVSGDLIITGCPARLNPEKTFLDQGHTFTSRVEGLGELVTYFKKEQP